MVSTPDEPGSPGEGELPESDAAASTPGDGPAGSAPPPPVEPPAGSHGPASTPGEAPQGYPPGYGPPAGYAPGSDLPGYPPPGYPPPGGQLPAYQRAGAGIGIGLAIGLGLVVVAFILLLTTIGAGLVGNLVGLLWPFIVIPVLVALLYFLPKWRMVATGVLIMFASVWLIVLGPCVVLIYGLGGA